MNAYRMEALERRRFMQLLVDISQESFLPLKTVRLNGKIFACLLHGGYPALAENEKALSHFMLMVDCPQFRHMR